jgi:hypothetical protein
MLHSQTLIFSAENAGVDDYFESIENVNFNPDQSTRSILSGYIVDYNANGFKLDNMLPKGKCDR